MSYAVHLLIVLGIAICLAESLDLITGHTGLLSMAHAAFQGLGAYVAALLSVHYRAPFLLCLLVGMGVGAACSLLISSASLRLRDDYFAIATFGFQVIVTSIATNWVKLTRGPLGIAGIPRPVVLGWVIDTQGEFLDWSRPSSPPRSS